MKNYVNNGTVYKLSTTHKEIDDGRRVSKEFMNMHKSMDYASQSKNHGKISWERLGALSQKLVLKKEGTNGLAVEI